MKVNIDVYFKTLSEATDAYSFLVDNSDNSTLRYCADDDNPFNVYGEIDAHSVGDFADTFHHAKNSSYN